MSEPDDLNHVEELITNLVARLKADVGSNDEKSRSGFFAKGIDFLTLKISDGRVNVELTLSGTAAPVPKAALPVRPDRLVQPMYVEVPPTPNTGIKSIGLEVNVIYTNGQSEKKVVTNLPVGSTIIDI